MNNFIILGIVLWIFFVGAISIFHLGDPNPLIIIFIITIIAAIFYFITSLIFIYKQRKQHFLPDKSKSILIFVIAVGLTILNYLVGARLFWLFYVLLAVPLLLTQSILGGWISRALGLTKNYSYATAIFLSASFGLIISYLPIEFTRQFINHQIDISDARIRESLLATGDISICNDLIFSRLRYVCPALAAVGRRVPELCLQAKNPVNCLSNASSIGKDLKYCFAINDFDEKGMFDTYKIFESQTQTKAETILISYETCIVSNIQYWNGSPSICSQLQKEEYLHLCFDRYTQTHK